MKKQTYVKKSRKINFEAEHLSQFFNQQWTQRSEEESLNQTALIHTCECS
jgi:hypothetical protein